MNEICEFKQAIDSWLHRNQIMQSIFLAILSIGLIGSYALLVHHMTVYFKKEMRLEVKKLTVLCATFVVAYALRFVY